jgi:hypothetical protein
MSSRFTPLLLALLSLTTSIVFVTSLATMEMDEAAYAPLPESSSASEQGPTKESTDSSGTPRPSTPSETRSQESERLPRSEDIEPLGEPMLA